MVPNEHLYCRFTLVTLMDSVVSNDILLFVSGNTLKIGLFHKLQPDFSTMAQSTLFNEETTLLKQNTEQLYKIYNRVIFIVPRYCGLSLLRTPNDSPEGVRYNES